MPPLAVRVVLGVVQLKAKPLLLLTEAAEAETSCVMMMLSVSEHPLAAVTVTVYVPGEFTNIPAELPRPLLHAYVPLPVAVNEMEVRLQVSSVLPVLLVIPADGAVLSSVVLTLVLAVHPLLAVAVTVYVPAVVTDIEVVVAPVLHA